MQGQWIGEIKGTNRGLAVLDFDDCRTYFKGHAVAWDSSGIPATLLPIETKDKSDYHELEVTPLHLDADSGDFLTPEEIFRIKSGKEIALPEIVKLEILRRPRSILVKWKTPIGTKGKVVLHPSKADKASIIESEPSVSNWDEFKSYAIDLEPNRYIFRGQCSDWRLRTSFHRTHRKDLLPFLNVDIPALHRVLTSKTKHVFNLANAQENGAFWNLVQHHGYPTPLLDWTQSPFVASFFAYNSFQRSESSSGLIRIFMFDRKTWCQDFNQVQKVTVVQPHFSILEALAIENERAIPQQSISSVTNIDDVETYIQRREAEQKKRYLRVIDIPVEQKEEILRELSMMGITPGSLFPGLDGACAEARARFFGYD